MSWLIFFNCVYLCVFKIGMLIIIIWILVLISYCYFFNIFCLLWLNWFIDFIKSVLFFLSICFKSWYFGWLKFLLLVLLIKMKVFLIFWLSSEEIWWFLFWFLFDICVYLYFLVCVFIKDFYKVFKGYKIFINVFKFNYNIFIN